MNEKKSPEKTLPDVQSRIENLLWAVSGDYELDIPGSESLGEISGYSSL